MPSRRPILPGTSISPRASSNAVNEVVNSLSRKLNNSQYDSPSTTSIPPPRRPSFSMENILHPNRALKKHEVAKEKERDARKDKRMSLATNKSSQSKDRVSGSSPRVVPVKPARFELIEESPRLVFHGNVNNSSGALFSGRMNLLVDDPIGKVTLTGFTMVLRATLTTKKPVGKECKDCIERHDDLKTWNFLTEPKTYLKGGDNQFPFSYLFQGNLPATTTVHIGSLTYQLVATATTSLGEQIDFIKALQIERAVPPGPEKASIRIFPPTNLTGRVSLPPVVHPIGTFPVQMTLSGVVEKRAESQTRWRLRKMLWRIEEHTKVISTPCAKHAGKVSDGKAVQHSEVKVLGNDEMKSGWKTDFDTIGGEIMLEWDCSLATKSSHRATCDMVSTFGLEVKHNLVVELIVAEEYCPNRNTQLITPTGAARVLRMQFALLVTERSGMGISWDEEQPPMYEDVPPSPPGYGSADKSDGAFGGAIMEDYDGPTIDPVDLERVSSENPNDPPLYRERAFHSIEAAMSPRNRRQTDTSDAGVEGSRHRLTGFRLDDLEAEPLAVQEAWRRRNENEHEGAIEEDYGEGEAGSAAAH